MALFSDKTWDQWIHEYSLSHQHPVNRGCHSLGIPLVILSIILLPFSLISQLPWYFASSLFVFGWICQFVGHCYEKSLPEFFKDWRFLLVGARWWALKTFAKR